jgi:hypothetical protein
MADQQPAPRPLVYRLRWLFFLIPIVVAAGASLYLLQAGGKGATTVTEPTPEDSAAVAPRDLRSLDLTEVPAPSGACGATREFIAKIDSPTLIDGDRGRVSVSVTDKAVFGDLDNDGNDELARELQCGYDGGNTSAGQGFVLLSGSDGQVKALGLIDARYTAGNAQARGVVRNVVIAERQVTASELWYRPTDPQCCPSGQAITTWSYIDQELKVVTSLPCAILPCP